MWHSDEDVVVRCTYQNQKEPRFGYKVSDTFRFYTIRLTRHMEPGDV
jgi:hypothetical protein